MAKITFIGDIHGKSDVYVHLCRHQELTLQVGDMGFSYAHLEELNPVKHKFIGGNHDNYDILRDPPPHYLGDYGLWNGVFYVRGAMSIDRDRRIEGVSWWKQEELSYKQGCIALKRYQKALPSIVVSHCAPTIVMPHLVNTHIPSRTDQLLQAMYDVHQPDLWIFGHFHYSLEIDLGKTKFICLKEFEIKTVEIEDGKEIITDKSGPNPVYEGYTPL